MDKLRIDEPVTAKHHRPSTRLFEILGQARRELLVASLAPYVARMIPAGENAAVTDIGGGVFQVNFSGGGSDTITTRNGIVTEFTLGGLPSTVSYEL